MTSNKRPGFTMIEVQAVVGLFLLLAALMLPSVGRAREAARRTQCRNNMKQLGLSVNNYENKFNIFPPASIVATPKQIVGGCKNSNERTGGFSWRVLILPYIEELKVYNKIWFDGTAGVMDCSGENGPPNAKYTTKAIKTQIIHFLCPSDPTLSGIDDGWHGSNYAAMISTRPDYRFTDNKKHATLSRRQDIGVMHAQKPARQHEVRNDGTSQTILTVEVDRSRKVIEQGAPKKSEHLRCGRWFNGRGCNADACRTPSDFGTDEKPKQDEASLDNAVVWDNFVGLNTHGWGRVGSSSHGGGCHVGMADSSVHWLSEKIDFVLYQATCTREGTETETIEF